MALLQPIQPFKLSTNPSEAWNIWKQDFMCYLKALKYHKEDNDVQTSLFLQVKIGVLPEMLIVHSDALQSDMLLTEIENNKCVVVEDMYPDTFRNLMRYVYGYDNTGSLTFDEADNLLYAAEKYLIEPLKARLATRLTKLISPENICSLLNNPACFKTLELSSAITEILQFETERVLACPLFLDLTSDSLIKVFEQKAMNVKEIDIWRAAVKWAKHQTKSDHGQDLRKVLEGAAKHIRVCAIDGESFLDEVCPTGILTGEEVKIVTISLLKKKKQDNLINFSNELECRAQHLPSYQLDFVHHTEYEPLSKVKLQIFTNEHAIELLPLKFTSEKWNMGTSVPERLTHECKCTITITRITDYVRDKSSDPPEVVEVRQQIEYGKDFTVPVTREGNNVVLLPDNKYQVQIDFNDKVQMFYSEENNNPYYNEHISVRFCSVSNYDNSFVAPFHTLFYRPISTIHSIETIET